MKYIFHIAILNIVLSLCSCRTSNLLHKDKNIVYSIEIFDGLKYMRILKDNGVAKCEYVIPLNKRNTDISNYKIEKKVIVTKDGKTNDTFFIGLTDSLSGEKNSHPEERIYIPYDPSEIREINSDEIKIFSDGGGFIK